jgi:hypothetical protein
MIRKLKSILNNKENNNQHVSNQFNDNENGSNIVPLSDLLMLPSCNGSAKNNINSQSPVNFIKKRKIFSQ